MSSKKLINLTPEEIMDRHPDLIRDAKAMSPDVISQIMEQRAERARKLLWDNTTANLFRLGTIATTTDTSTNTKTPGRMLADLYEMTAKLETNQPMAVICERPLELLDLIQKCMGMYQDSRNLPEGSIGLLAGCPVFRSVEDVPDKYWTPGHKVVKIEV